MGIQNSEVRIQNGGSGTPFRILDSGFWIPFFPFWLLNSVFCILFVAFPTGLLPEIIDRIVITVGNQVITQSQIDDEIRVTAFLNRDKLDLTADAKKQAASRLIEQALIKREMDLSRYPLPELSDAGESLETLKAMYSTETEFQDALQAYGITADELTRRLWWQLTLLRFIDYRFRPGIQIPAADVQAYYQQQVSAWEQKGTKPIPTLQESRDQIEEILTQKRIDQALEQWIKDTRSQVTITYLDPGLK
jgi:peptidyl-prolyl cis-trans isomerase SurA